MAHRSQGLSTLVSLRVETPYRHLLEEENLNAFSEHVSSVIQKHGFTERKTLLDVFPGGGHSGAKTLAESHVAWHSWPELNFITIDMHVCDYSRNNEGACMNASLDIAAFFQPGHVSGAKIRWYPDGTVQTVHL